MLPCLPVQCPFSVIRSTYLYISNIAAPWHGAAGDSSGGHRRRRRGLLSTAADAVSRQTAALLEPLLSAGVSESAAGAAAAGAAAGRALKVGFGQSREGKKDTAASMFAEVLAGRVFACSICVIFSLTCLLWWFGYILSPAVAISVQIVL
jgi:hypothetical protein